MKRLRFTVIKNALSNIVRGGAGAIVALALPHFLTRSLNHDRFAAWSLILQIAAYANFLDFGLQTAVARYLAQAVERKDDRRRDELVSTALSMLSAAGCVAFIVICVVMWQMPRLFRSAPAGLIGEMSVAIVVLASSSALLLPLSTFTGVLVGLHRNEYPALAIGSTRILGAAVIIVVSRHTQSLVLLAACLGAFNLLGGFIQLGMVRRMVPEMRIAFSGISKNLAWELAKYCGALTIWSFGMFLVSGLDVTLVGYFDFQKVGYYALASTLINFFSSGNNYVMSALLAPLATLQARHETDRIGKVVLSATRAASLVNVAFVVAVFWAGKYILQLWVGRNYADGSLLFLKLLAVGQAIRLLGAAYSTALVATGLQNYGIPCVVVEGVSNLTLSILIAMRIGAAGIAWGTVFGSIIAVIVLIAVVMRPRRDLVIQRRQFVFQGVVLPLLVFSPFFMWVAFRR